MDKPKKCYNTKCKKTSKYKDRTNDSCIGCISTSGRKHASHTKMEHQILGDISRGLEKNGLKHDNDDEDDGNNRISYMYDQVYIEKKRPDLKINNLKSNNIIIIEIDEKQHFTPSNFKKDKERIELFRKTAKEDCKTVSVIRIVPGENTYNSMFKTIKRNTDLYRDTSGYIEKIPENYNKYIKKTVHSISKIIVDPDNYKYLGRDVSIGPNQRISPTSPQFSDTSSPASSPDINRAKAYSRIMKIALLPKLPSFEEFENMKKNTIPADMHKYSSKKDDQAVIDYIFSKAEAEIERMSNREKSKSKKSLYQMMNDIKIEDDTEFRSSKRIGGSKIKPKKYRKTSK